MAFIRDYDGGYYGVRWVWDVPGDDYFDVPDIDTDTDIDTDSYIERED